MANPYPLMSSKRLLKLNSLTRIERACQSLAPYLTTQRKQRINQLLQHRLASIHVAIEAPSNPHNAAAIVRSCDAFGIANIHVTHTANNILHAKGTTQGAFHWVNTHHHPTFDDFLTYFAKNSMQPRFIIAGAVLDARQSLHQLSLEQPLCLLFGNETCGLSSQALSHCHTYYTIPTVGMSQSLNLSNAAAISLYDITQRKRQLLKKPGDLTTQAITALRLCYYSQSLDQRLSQIIFKQHEIVY